LLLWLWAAKCTDEQQLQQERDQLSQQQVVLSKRVHTQVPLPLAVAKQVSVEQAEQFHKMSDATEAEGQLAAAAAAVGPQEVFQSTDRQLLLDAHNRLRSLHQSPGLTWSNTLAQQAGVWVSQCDLSTDPNAASGEVMYAISGMISETTSFLPDMVNQW
jgi:uncharacterized protein YkwD